MKDLAELLQMILIRAPNMKGTRDNFFSFLYENIRYDPLLELSQQDGINDGSQCMFYLKK